MGKVFESSQYAEPNAVLADSVHQRFIYGIIYCGSSILSGDLLPKWNFWRDCTVNRVFIVNFTKLYVRLGMTNNEENRKANRFFFSWLFDYNSAEL